MTLTLEENADAQLVIDALRRGYEIGEEHNRLDEKYEQDGPPGSIFPPPGNIHSFIDIDPAVLRFDPEVLKVLRSYDDPVVDTGKQSN